MAPRRVNTLAGNFYPEVHHARTGDPDVREIEGLRDDSRIGNVSALRTDNAPPTPPSSSSIVDSKVAAAELDSKRIECLYCYQGRCEPSFHVCAAAAVEGVSLSR